MRISDWSSDVCSSDLLPAPLAILSTIFEGAQLPFDKALSVESKYFAKLLTDPVARNIIRTTFISKQAAEKGARSPSGVPKSEAKKVGVLGAGMMGAGLAYVSANSGMDRKGVGWGTRGSVRG